jgi:dGTPase
MEVAQIARAIAKILRLNEDLTEAIALAHDIGHTPFGHSGEKKLNELMKDHGGFEHNKQSLRIVEELEEKYPDFPGLNLTYEVREGLDKHKTDYDSTGNPKFGPGCPTLEAQIVNISDEIAYSSHDLDDGLTSKILKENDLKELSILKGLFKENEKLTENRKKYQIIRNLINIFITDLVSNTKLELEKNDIKTIEQIRERTKPLVSFSKAVQEQKNELNGFLYKNFYRHYKVIRMEVKHQRILEELFTTYIKNFGLSSKTESILPEEIRKKADKNNSKERVVCDYIAGMTDRYAVMEYKKLFDPLERV